MPVNHQRLPAEAGPPGAITLHVVLQHGGIALTQSIDIDNGTEVIQAMIARDFNRFPRTLQEKVFGYLEERARTDR